MLPSFIGIGAQRCGTTWLYECLAAHPQVFVSTPKELYFFTKNFARGLDWYEGHFDSGAAALARGEITPGYFYRPEALQRIATLAPDARLFVILRNPVDRALSAFDFFRAREYSGMDFRAAIERDKSILGQGMYSVGLKRLRTLFPADQCLVLLYDDIVAAPATLVAQLYDFVGVDSGFRPDMLRRRVNQAIFPRTQKMLVHLGLRDAIDWVKHTALGDAIQNWHTQRRKPSRMENSEDRQFLIDYYREEVDCLRNLLGRDLPGWSK